MTITSSLRFLYIWGYLAYCVPPPFSYVVGDIAAMYHLKYYKQHGGATFITYLPM